MHACMYGMMWMYDACGAHVGTCMHADTHTIHMCLCVHARMSVGTHVHADTCGHACGAHVSTYMHAGRRTHAHKNECTDVCGHTYACGHVWTRMHVGTCGHACACRQAYRHTIHIWVCVHGTMRVDTCGHVCTCACVVLMVPVSDFLCHCLARAHFRIYLPGIPVSLSGCATRTQHAPRVGGAPAGVVPRVLWIGGSCVHVRCAGATRTCTRAHVGGVCSHARMHRGEAPAGWVPHGLWIMHACAPHIYTNTHAHNICMCMGCSHMHILVECSSHAHTHTRTCTRTRMDMHACLVACSSHTHTYMYTCIHV